jgi:hypothetical protein
MPRGNRLYRIAAGGCLVGLLMASSSYAQEAERPSPTIEEAQGRTGNAPAPQPPAREEAAQPQPQAQQAPPSVPLLDQGTAEPSCGPRCQAAEQRDKDDLIAQQVMADSTARMTSAAWWQVGLSIIAVFLIGVTARYAYRAAVAAETM